MAAPPLLTLHGIELSFGGTPLLEGADLMIGERDRICLVGRNGSGKSTLLRIAAGLVEADGGQRFVQPGRTVHYLPQEPDLSTFKTVREAAQAALTEAQDPYAAEPYLADLGLDPDADPATLSGGESRKVALVQALAPEPDILLVDEPTNHLDMPTIEWLENTLGRLRSALLLISHDRRFLETLSNATVWIDRGVTRRLDKGFKHFEAWRDETLEREELERHKLDRKIAMEEDWLRYGVTARRKRNVRRLGQLHELRDKARTHRGPTGLVKLDLQDADASGKRVVEVKGLSKSYGDRPIVADLDLRIARGDRIGIVGPNGAGKTTLVRLLLGELEPDTGSRKLGANLEIVSLDQHRESLDPNTSLADALTGGKSDQVVIGNSVRHVVSYMKDFLFQPEQATTPLRVLSGGERGRLMLARALARASNVLVLDEPTNDLDLETLDLLQEMLTDYDGTLLLVSHDRDFLDRVVSTCLMSEGDGHWRAYAGGYSDMVAQRGRGIEAPRNSATTTEPAKAGGKKKATGQSAELVSEKPSGQTTPTTNGAQASGKLTYKDKRDLENLPKEIAVLEKKIRAVEDRMAAPDFYTKDPSGFEKAVALTEKLRGELAGAEERWLELEMRREELGL